MPEEGTEFQLPLGHPQTEQESVSSCSASDPALAPGVYTCVQVDKRSGVVPVAEIALEQLAPLPLYFTPANSQVPASTMRMTSTMYGKLIEATRSPVV